MRKTNVIKLLLNKEGLRVLNIVADRVSALWNAANYLCRQAFINAEGVPNYSRLCSVMKDNPDYRALPTDIGQEVLKKVAKAWVSYFRLRKLHYAGKIQNKPGMPRYRKDRRTGLRPRGFIPVKSTKAYAVLGSVLHLAVPEDLHSCRIELPFRGVIRYKGDLKTCEFHYDSVKRAWYAHIVVEAVEPTRKDRPAKYATADLGARRTLAISTEDGLNKVFSARALWKDYRYWTRRIAKEQSRFSAQGLKTSRKLMGFYRMRRLRLRHGLEAMSAATVNFLKSRGVTSFKVGYPKGCREDMHFGRKINALVHNFWSFDLTLDILEKHCLRRGIAFERINEADTSEVCHICCQRVKRPIRSVVVCPVHGKTHADVNASLNMLKVYTPDYGDGVKATSAWTTYEWHGHSWLPRAKSAEHRVLRPAA